MKYDYADAVYALNSYVNKALKVNLEWAPVSYTNSMGETVSATPIIPSQQQPELLATGKSFLVYGSAIEPVGKVWGLVNESVVYTVWSTSAREANATANLIRDLFQITDETAENVNTWLELEGGYNKATGAWTRDRHIAFTAIRAGFIEKAEPSTQEDGWVSAMVTVETQYQKKNHSPVTRFTTV